MAVTKTSTKLCVNWRILPPFQSVVVSPGIQRNCSIRAISALKFPSIANVPEPPRRPPGAFIMYKLSLTEENVPNAAKQWNSSSSEEKEPFLNRFKDEYAQYLAKKDEYVARLCEDEKERLEEKKLYEKILSLEKAIDHDKRNLYNDAYEVPPAKPKNVSAFCAFVRHRFSTNDKGEKLNLSVLGTEWNHMSGQEKKSFVESLNEDSNQSTEPLTKTLTVIDSYTNHIRSWKAICRRILTRRNLHVLKEDSLSSYTEWLKDYKMKLSDEVKVNNMAFKLHKRAFILDKAIEKERVSTLEILEDFHQPAPKMSGYNIFVIEQYQLLREKSKRVHMKQLSKMWEELPDEGKQKYVQNLDPPKQSELKLPESVKKLSDYRRNLLVIRRIYKKLISLQNPDEKFPDVNFDGFKYFKEEQSKFHDKASTKILHKIWNEMPKTEKKIYTNLKYQLIEHYDQARKCKSRLLLLLKKRKKTS